MRKIVITGATGMIGAALAKCAASAGIEILCIVRKDSGRLGNLPKSGLIKVEYCGIDEYPNLNLVADYDVFFHLAWDKTSGALRDDVDIQLKNIQYTLDAVRLAKRLGCKKFVGAGSQAEYGVVTERLCPDTPVNPSSGYGIAKYTAGKLSRLLCSQIDMQFNWVRILSVFGPLDGAQTLIMYAINELLAGRSPELTRCEQMWDYLYCDDAAGALLALGDRGVDGKTYPLGSGSARRLSEYLESLKSVVKPDGALLFGKKDYYPHQPMYLCADISELTADTGWRPEVLFEDGIGRIITAK
ncbi:MAG: NAD(P)-dependent oxidoreductase [Chitinispirillia bacterium]|nr:NAD(P)-dependent oxidoreductase [Chitinispirillia bacterium]MCL2268778.1 NAD(P)-dependent oxidoreductase [Chitinispirillia bacterium]